MNHRDPHLARQSAAIVAIVLVGLYLATAAPGITFWDASEFATAIGTFGVPHPPGTPLYIATGTALWQVIPLVSPVQAGTLLSILSTAGACAIGAWLVTTLSGTRTAGIAAGLCAGAMGTVWLNATETEVYALSLLSVSLQLLAAWRAHQADDDRARVAVFYLAALSIPLHLSALVATPAALLLAQTDRSGRVRWLALTLSAGLVLATVALSRRSLLGAGACLATVVASAVLLQRTRGTSMRHLAAGACVTLLGWSSALIMLVRARQSPFLNQGDPDTFAKLLDVVARVQYDVAPIWPRRAPLWLQVGNLAQWSDWQVALGLWNDVTPAWQRTPFTLLAVALGAVGAIVHWRTSKISSRTMLALFALATAGVVMLLNLRAGPSFGIGVLPPTALHEARERDYFFALAFWCWGLWMGVGAFALATRFARRSAVAVALPAVMIAGSVSATTRDALPDRIMARVLADELLHDVPRRGVLFTAGDNDSYPLWYRQAVDSVRPDVRVVVLPLLPANWYFRESSLRAAGFDADTTLHAGAIRRASHLARTILERDGVIALSLLISSAERAELGRLAGVTCWRRVGLIDLGSKRAICPPRVDVERSMNAASRLQVVRQGSVRVSPDGIVQAFQRVAGCPDATVSQVLRGGVGTDSATAALLDITCNLR